MNASRWIAAIVLIVSTGCKNDAHEAGEAHAEVCSHSLTASEYADEKIYDQPGVQVGQLTRCPISSSVFRVGEMSPKVEHGGKTYYTCCGGCTDQLQRSFARRTN